MSHINKFSEELGLGKHQDYPRAYDPGLLQPIARQLNRQHLPNANFSGCDIWTAYELSWLDLSGKPCVAIAEVTVPADSVNIIESKSFKYYLNSLNQERIERQHLIATLQKDLSDAVDGDVEISLHDLDTYRHPPMALTTHECVDRYELVSPTYTPTPAKLTDGRSRHDANALKASQQNYVSHLLKSNCPVTGQPDWASIWISLKGADLAAASFLAYIVSYRDHQDFHENCVEQIYSDLQEQLQPESLWVYARYTRRGGLDINPFRSSGGQRPPQIRGARQ